MNSVSVLLFEKKEKAKSFEKKFWGPFTVDEKRKATIYVHERFLESLQQLSTRRRQEYIRLFVRKQLELQEERSGDDEKPILVYLKPTFEASYKLFNRWVKNNEKGLKERLAFDSFKSNRVTKGKLPSTPKLTSLVKLFSFLLKESFDDTLSKFEKAGLTSNDLQKTELRLSTIQTAFYSLPILEKVAENIYLALVKPGRWGIVPKAAKNAVSLMSVSPKKEDVVFYLYNSNSFPLPMNSYTSDLNQISHEVKNLDFDEQTIPRYDGHASPLQILTEIKDLQAFLPFQYYFERNFVGTDLFTNAATISHLDFEAKGLNGLDFNLERIYSSLNNISLKAESLISENLISFLENLNSCIDGIEQATYDEIFDVFFPMVENLRAWYWYGGTADIDPSFEFWDMQVEVARRDPQHLLDMINSVIWPHRVDNDVSYFLAGVDNEGDTIWRYGYDPYGGVYVLNYEHKFVQGEEVEAAQPVYYYWAESIVATKLLEALENVKSWFKERRRVIKEQLDEAKSNSSNNFLIDSPLGDGWIFAIPFIRPEKEAAPGEPDQSTLDGIIFFDGYRKAIFGQLDFKYFFKEKAIFKKLTASEKKSLAQKKCQYTITRQIATDPSTGAPTWINVDDFGEFNDIKYLIEQNEHYYYFDDRGRLRFEMDYSQNNSIEYDYDQTCLHQITRITDTIGNTFNFSYGYTDSGEEYYGYSYPIRFLTIESKDNLGNKYKKIRYWVQGTELGEISEVVHSFEKQKTRYLKKVEELPGANNFYDQIPTQQRHITEYQYDMKLVFSMRLNFRDIYFEMPFLKDEINPLGGITSFIYQIPEENSYYSPLTPQVSLLHQNTQAPPGEAKPVLAYYRILNPAMAKGVLRNGQLVLAHSRVQLLPKSEIEGSCSKKKVVVAKTDRVEVYQYEERLTETDEETWVLVKKQVYCANYRTQRKLMGFIWYDPVSLSEFVARGLLEVDLKNAIGDHTLSETYNYDRFANSWLHKTITGNTRYCEELIEARNYLEGSLSQVFGLPKEVILKDSLNHVFSYKKFVYHQIYFLKIISVGGDTQAIDVDYEHPLIQDPERTRNPTTKREIERGGQAKRIETNYWYDKFGRIIKIKDGLSHETLYTYSEQNSQDGKKVFVTQETKKGTNHDIIKSFHLDAFGKLILSVDGRGNNTKYIYDDFGRVQEMILTDNSHILFDYGDRYANLTKNVTQISQEVTLNPNSYYSTIIESNKWGNLAKITRALDMQESGVDKTELFYDQMCRLCKIVFNDDARIEYYYDSIDRPVLTIDSRGGRTSTLYDDTVKYRTENGKLFLTKIKTVKDPGGSTQSFYLDHIDRLRLIKNEVQLEFDDSVSNVFWEYQWDSWNRLSSSIDPYGVITVWIYDDFSRLKESIRIDGAKRISEKFEKYNDLHMVEVYTDSRGNSRKFSYDDFNRLQKISCEIVGVSKTLASFYGDTIVAYDDNDNLLSIKQGDSETVYTYNLRNQAETVTDPEDNVFTYFYDCLGRLIASADPYKHIRKWTYNSRNLLCQFTDEKQASYQWSYNKYGGLSSSVGPLGLQTKLTYRTNPAGDITTITNSRGEHYHISRDAFGRPVKYTIKSLGLVFGYHYNTYGEIHKVIMPDESIWSYRDDAYGRFLGCLSPEGRKVEFEYDGFCNLKKSHRGNDRDKWTYEYDSNGNMTNIFNPYGQIITYHYDNLDRLSKIDYMGNPACSNYKISNGEWPSIKIDYEGLRGKTTVTDVDSNIYVFEKDRNGLIRKTIDPEKNVVWYGRDKLGRLNVLLVYPDGLISDPNNPTTFPLDSTSYYFQRFDYDSCGRLSRIRYGDKSQLSLKRDLSGNVYKIRDEEGWITELTIDPVLCLPISLRGPDRIERKIVRDTIGRVIFTDLDGVPIEVEYKEMGRKIVFTTSRGRKIQYELSADQLLRTRLSPSGAICKYQYDYACRLFKVKTPTGSEVQYNYTNIDSIIGIDVGGQRIQDTFTYEVDGRLATVQNNLGETRFSYYPNGFLHKIDYSDGQWTEFNYRKDGCLEKIIYSNGVTKTLDYDHMKMLSQIIEGRQKLSFQRDARLRVEKEILEDQAGGKENTICKYLLNGTVSRIEGPYGNTTYIFDQTTGVLKETIIEDLIGTKPLHLFFDYFPNGWHKGCHNAYGYDQNFSYYPDCSVKTIMAPNITYSIDYDANGNPAKIERKENGIRRTDSYRYDAEDRLVKINKDIQYLYDDKGNIIGILNIANNSNITKIYDLSNHLSKVFLNDLPFQGLKYDVKGNLIEIEEYLNPKFTSFIYDEDNRLRQIKQAIPFTSENLYESLSYDPVDRLQENFNSSSGQGERLIHFGRFLTGWKTQVSSFSFLPNIQDTLPFAMIGNDSCLVSTRLLGSTSAVHNQFGELQGIQNRLPYGEEVNNDRLLDPIGFKGYFQLQGGLHWAFTRVYSSKLCSFLSPDLFSGYIDAPISINRQHVFSSNPLRYSDNLGLIDIECNPYPSVASEQSSQKTEIFMPPTVITGTVPSSSGGSNTYHAAQDRAIAPSGERRDSGASSMINYFSYLDSFLEATRNMPQINLPKIDENTIGVYTPFQRSKPQMVKPKKPVANRHKKSITEQVQEGKFKPSSPPPIEKSNDLIPFGPPVEPDAAGEVLRLSRPKCCEIPIRSPEELRGIREGKILAMDEVRMKAENQANFIYMSPIMATASGAPYISLGVTRRLLPYISSKLFGKALFSGIKQVGKYLIKPEISIEINRDFALKLKDEFLIGFISGYIFGLIGIPGKEGAIWNFLTSKVSNAPESTGRLIRELGQASAIKELVRESIETFQDE